MHIHQIDIDNFKSFYGRTVIPFETGFTTISGPNGSGKSNIIDSILFCLGLSSSRTMRAEKLTDLINNLSGKREATVSITFGPDDATLLDTDTPDNPEFYSKFLVISRRIKDSGKSGYTSTYYLNGRVSTLTEIHDTLAQHNVSPGTYNVLMQGDVTGIINMTATERRKIIDEIAGVADFDRKIEQAEKELASVGGSIERFTILLDELGHQLEQLRTEREQALKYQAFKDEKQQAEGQRQLVHYNDLKQSIHTLQQQITITQSDKRKAAQALEQIDTQLESVRRELAEISQEVKRKGEDQQIALKKQIESLKGAVARKEDAIAFGKQKQEDNKGAVVRCHEEIARLNQKIAELKTTMAEFSQQRQDVETALAKEKARFDALDTQLAEFNAAHGELSQQRITLRESLTLTQDNIAQLGRDKADCQAEHDRTEREIGYLQQRTAKSSDERAQLIEQKTQLVGQIKDLKLEAEAFQTQLNAHQLVVSKKRVELQQLTAKLNDVHRQFVQADAQRRAFEEANFGRSVDTILKAGIPGVHGTLAQLGDTNEQYAVALEIALGARLKSIVVDNDRVAQEGIQLLQEKRAGRATFLPLNKMRSPHKLGNLPNDGGVIDFAINLMSFESKYDAVFAYALGDTVIVDSMNTARQHLNQYRMVTLDGSLLEKTGAMTGGSTQQGGGKLGGQKWDQVIAELRTELESLDEIRDKLERQLSKDELKLDQLKDDYAAQQTGLHKLEAELAGTQRSLAQLIETTEANPELEALQKTLASFAPKLGTFEQNIEAAQKTLAELEAQLADIDAKIPESVFNTIRQERDAIELAQHELESKLRQNQADHHSRQLEMEFHEKAITSYHEQITKLGEADTQIDAERVGQQEEITVIHQQIEALLAQTGELDEELKQLQAKRDIVQAQLIEQEREKFDCLNKVQTLEETLKAYQSRQRELNDTIGQLRTELAEAQIDPDEHDLTKLPTLDDLERQIQKLTRQMDAMGAVNMKAIEAYDDVSERHIELQEKIDTLNREQQDLTIKIQGYGELKLHAFKTAFDNVNSHFREIFEELSDGEGQLVLTNPEDPFSGGLTIEARPRGKKTLRLESMSGGEKSLTALAFVFSFQRYMPAPFYAFDEVDMFLDGINAEKLAHMVQKQALQTQFIVVSLRKPMIENSQRTVGVTQKKNGITKVTGVRLTHAS